MRSEYHEGLNSDQAVHISMFSSGNSIVGKIKKFVFNAYWLQGFSFFFKTFVFCICGERDLAVVMTAISVHAYTTRNIAHAAAEWHQRPLERQAPVPDLYAALSRNIDGARRRPHADRPFLLALSPAGVSAHRSEGIRRWTDGRFFGRGGLRRLHAAATYSMHTLCTTHGRPPRLVGRPAATYLYTRNIRSVRTQQMSLAMFTAAQR